jgi:hypothetical protein
MSRSITALILTVAVGIAIAAPASAADRRTRNEVRDRAEAQQAGARWNAKGVEELDIDCDGNVDYAIGGRGNGAFYVAVVMGPIERTTGAFVIELPTGSEGPVICDEDPAIMVQSSDYDPSELLGGRSPEGFQRSETCQELAVGLECMKFHIYWNHSAGQLGVWN